MSSLKAAVCAMVCAFALGPQLVLAQKIDKQDAKALQDLVQAGMAEVEAGKLAAEKAQSDEVRKFAQHMVADHDLQLSELQQIARSKGVALPAAPKPRQQAALKKLQAASGDEFDRAYMAQRVKDHGEALQLARSTAKQARDRELKAEALKAAPEIEERLQLARQIAGGTGAKSK